MAKKVKRNNREHDPIADGELAVDLGKEEPCPDIEVREMRGTLAIAPQSIKLVSVTVPAGEMSVKSINSDPADPMNPVTVFDMTAGAMTVVGNCINLTGDVKGSLIGLDTNLNIPQAGFTVYNGAGSRRWSLTIPSTPQAVAGIYPVVLQVAFTTSGGPPDSVPFSVSLPGPPPPPPPPPPH